MIFVKDVYPLAGCLSPVAYLFPLFSLSLISYLPKSLLRVYIRVRKYGLAVLAGPIVMITTHNVAK